MDRGHEAPLVTIGMPVYNESRFIKDSIESLLAQTYPNLRIVVWDNASTDGTAEIVADRTSVDGRLELVQRPGNVGALQNFNEAARQADGEYFMWAAGHDLWSPDYVEGLVAVLENDRRASVAFGDVSWIGEDGAPAEARPSRVVDMNGINNPVTRFNLMFWLDQNAIYGVVRSRALRRSRLMPDCAAPGAVFLAELAILGRLRHVPDVTFYRRLNRPAEERLERYERYAATFYSSPRRQRFPHWRLPLEYLRVAAKTPLFGRARRQRRFLLLLSALNSGIRYWPDMRSNVRTLWRRSPKEEG